MTTFLPLIIIVTYVVWSIRPAQELLELSTAELAVLLGDYATILLTVDAELGFMAGVLQWASRSLGGLWYVNAIDTVLMFAGIASGALISVIYVILLIRWTTGSIVRPVHEVLRGMERAASGKFDHHTLVRERNEIGELSIGFNRMNDQLGAYFDRVSRLNEAYYQFVPEQFLQILGRERIEDVELGDQTQREMTLLFSDIRSFTALTEQMTPEESFLFINDYLGAMEPAIVENDGFIDKFIGDAIMAIFDATPANAVRASIAMSRALERFNESRTQAEPVATGIGIHTGMLMLGLVGGKQRMDGTVISDAVNVASRLEGLTKHFGCRVVMSAVSAGLAGEDDAWSTRPLGRVAVTGRGEPIAIVEVLDLASESDREKARTRERFALALRKYQEGAFAPAEQIFTDLLDQNPHDGPARFYLGRCKAAVLETPNEWSGVEVFESK
jgi:class 3 adenylate cyclase